MLLVKLSVAYTSITIYLCSCFFFQAEDGIRYLVRSRGLGDVYKRQADEIAFPTFATGLSIARIVDAIAASAKAGGRWKSCLLYTSDAADERSSVDLGGRRIIKKNNKSTRDGSWIINLQLPKRSRVTKRCRTNKAKENNI